MFSRRWRLCSGRRAPERALVEHLAAAGAHGPLDLVRDAEPLEQHMHPHACVPVALPTVSEELRHLRPHDPSRGTGNYDAQKGDEVVTSWRRAAQPLAKLGGMQRGLRVVRSLSVIALLAGCGSSAKHAAISRPAAKPKQAASTDARVGDPAAAPRPRCRSGTSRRLGSAHVTVAAVVRRRARAYRLPGRGELASFDHLNVNGYPTVFRALAAVRAADCRPAWYRVQLPIRPNGVTGYVPARSVETGTVHTKIVVDVSSRRLTFFDDGRRVLRTTVAVGASATPTPTGAYYVNQKLIPGDPSGPYGPGAIGI